MFKLIRAFLLFLLLSVSVRAGAPWPGVTYTEVRAFAWAKAPPHVRPPWELIRPDMTFVDGVINKEGTVLNAGQVKRLLSAEARRLVPRGVAGCYFPHNAFVFYDAEKRPVAYLEVCFDCLGHRTSPIDEQCDPDFIALAALCAELKLPFGEEKTGDAFRKQYGWLFKMLDENAPKAK